MTESKAEKRTKRGKSRAHRKGERLPSRHCAGCGAPDEDDALLRLALTEEHGVVADPRGRLPGRAIHLHPAPGCVAQCAEASVSGEVLRDAMVTFLDGAILRELSRAAASGQVIGGHDKLALALRAGEVAWVLTASDAASGTLESLQHAAGPLAFHAVGLDKEQLGARVGQAPRAAVGLPSSRASAVFAKWLALRQQLGGSTS